MDTEFSPQSTSHQGSSTAQDIEMTSLLDDASPEDHDTTKDSSHGVARVLSFQSGRKPSLSFRVLQPLRNHITRGHVMIACGGILLVGALILAGFWHFSRPGTGSESNSTTLDPTIPKWRPPPDNSSYIKYESELLDSIHWSQDPCYDFYEYMCKNWKHPKSHVIQSMHDFYRTLHDAFVDGIKSILKMNYARRMVVDLYERCLKHYSVDDHQRIDDELKRMLCIQEEIFPSHTLVVFRIYIDHLTGGSDRRKFEAIREKVTELIGHIKDAFRDMVESRLAGYRIGWLDDESRRRVVRKLDHMHSLVGYPDFIFNDTLLDAIYENGELLEKGFEERKEQFEKIVKRNIKKLGKIVPKIGLWSISTENAAYNRKSNTIYLPLPALLEPLFDLTYPAALNFAGLGFTIAHEITHGFAKQGSDHDQHGRHSPGGLWTNYTRVHFEAQTKCFVDQYGRIPTETGGTVNGVLSLNENIADNGGVKIAYYALQKYRDSYQDDEPLAHAQPKSLKERFTKEQLYFASLARSWCEPPPDPSRRQEFPNRAHIPPWDRINVALCNFDKFSQAFACREDARLNCREKCIIW